MTDLALFPELARPAPRLIDGDDVVTLGTREAWATFSVDMLYRYVLGRVWNPDAALLVACMLNPSTATEAVLDPTLRRIRGFAEREHMGGFIIVNCFAYRSTDRRALRKVRDPIGPRNDEAIRAAVDRPLAGLAVAAWGRPDSKAIAQRMARVRALPTRRHWWHLGLTADGCPKHPLYLPSSSPITLWVPT